MTRQNILFDLDGTLTDPKLGITRSIRYALEKLGRPAPASDELTWCIGPPLLESLQKLLKCEDLALPREALALYRERFSEVGKFENSAYPDIPELLQQLQQQQHRLFLATSKPEVFAREILEHFHLSPYFTGIYGSKLNGDLSDKSDLIRHVMQQEELHDDSTLMVGDRKHDILGAGNCGIKSLGVLYGYGDRPELVGAGADFLADKPLEILNIVGELQKAP